MTPEKAMKGAILAAKRESKAKCLGKGWQANIDRDCSYAGDNYTHYDEKGRDVGPYQCIAMGSNHRGSCR